MIASPLGGLYEVASVAEHEGKTEITIDVSLRWRVEAIKADYFVTPTVEFRLEDHDAGPMPRLVKDREARELAPPSKAGGTWRCVLAKGETVRRLYIFRFLRYIYFAEYIIFLICIFVHISFD